MGSVNRDFVFRELQAGRQTHNSHMDAHRDKHATDRREKDHKWQVTYCTDSIQRGTRARAEATCTHSDTQTN